MFKFAGKVELKISGLNYEKLINLSNREGVNTYHLKRLTYTEVECEIDSSNYKKFVEILAKNKCEITSQKWSGLVGLKQGLLKRYGLFIGIILSILFCALSFTRIWKIEVLGCDNECKREIIQLLSKNSVKVGSQIARVNNEEIENYLLTSSDTFSLVSVIKEGTSLIINAKQKNETNIKIKDFQPLLASCSGVVQSVNLIQGTLLVKVGDIVKKGDVLVAPYFMKGEEKLDVEPKAEIMAKSWCEAICQFEENGQILVRTGNYTDIRRLDFCGINIKTKSRIVVYEYYEFTKSSKNICNNMLLPFKMIKERYYELKFVKDIRTFAEVSDTLIAESKQQARAKVSSSMTTVSEKTSISHIGPYYYVRTVIEVSLLLI